MSLPSVYANKIDKVFNNNDVLYREDLSKNETRDIRELIRYFDSKGYSDRLKVKLYYGDNTESIERLILYKGEYFINIDNNKIYLKDIVNYEIQ